MKVRIEMTCTFDIETNEDDVYRALAKQQLVSREIINRLDQHIAEHAGETTCVYNTDLGPAIVEMVNFDDREVEIITSAKDFI